MPIMDKIIIDILHYESEACNFAISKSAFINNPLVNNLINRAINILQKWFPTNEIYYTYYIDADYDIYIFILYNNKIYKYDIFNDSEKNIIHIQLIDKYIIYNPPYYKQIYFVNNKQHNIDTYKYNPLKLRRQYISILSNIGITSFFNMKDRKKKLIIFDNYCIKKVHYYEIIYSRIIKCDCYNDLEFKYTYYDKYINHEKIYDINKSFYYEYYKKDSIFLRLLKLFI